MTICLYLPDGRVAFMFKRPEVHDNDAFDAAGMRFEVIEPFEHLRVSYDGKVVVLDDRSRWPIRARRSPTIRTRSAACASSTAG